LTNIDKGRCEICGDFLCWIEAGVSDEKTLGENIFIILRNFTVERRSFIDSYVKHLVALDRGKNEGLV